jgi:hypothetical protein
MKKQMNWKDRLEYIRIDILSCDISSDEWNHLDKRVARQMQWHFPGPYTVEQSRLPNGKLIFKLKFEDPREETMWMLKYS